MDIELQDRIDDYLLNRMPDNERTAFEMECANNAELQDQLKFTQNVRNVVRRRGEMLAKIKEWGEEYQRKEKRAMAASEYRVFGSGYDRCAAPTIRSWPSKSKQKGSNRKRIVYWASGVAAVFVVGIFLVHGLIFTGGDSGAEYYATQSVGGASFRGYAFRAGTDYAEIETLIGRQQYDRAIELINREFSLLQYWYMEVYSNSTLDLEQREYKILQIKEQEDDLLWLSVHALLGLEQRDEALQLLDRMRNRDGYYQQLADSLYRKISW